jgi:xylulokinase
VIFTPWLNGERTPVDNPFLRAGIFNLSLRTDISHIIRSAMEGVAFNCKWSLKYVEKFIKRKMDTLNIIGGGAKSDVWCQIFADVMDRTIRKVKDPLGANARGAAFIASVALGEIAFDDIPSLVEYDKTFEPNPAYRKIYDELYDAFLAIYRNNKNLYRRLLFFSAEKKSKAKEKA